MDSKAVWPGWETVRLIGRGSFGAVYEIERDVFGHKEKAALKVISIPQNDSDIEELYDSGYDEASVTATFKSHLESIVNEYSLMREMNGAANVVNCDDFRIEPHDDNIGWDIFIKMELLTPLTKALSQQPTDTQVVRIAEDMCRALALCRKYGIIHRDIKPQNIFVSKNGDYKLGDFGIAKTIEKTSGGTKIGTYKYMAPEVYNNQPYNLTADIYSLGLVLHWMLNERRAPFMPLPPAPAIASQEEEARAKRFNGEAIPAPAHGTKELKCIVLKACAFDPKDRYQTADEMLADLENLYTPIKKTAPEQKTEEKQIPKKEEAAPAGRQIPIEPEPEEDGTTGAFKAPVRTAPNLQPIIPQPEEDGTVGAFKAHEPRPDNREADDDSTVGAFGRGEKIEPVTISDDHDRKKKTVVRYFIAAVLAILIDQATKIWIVGHYAMYTWDYLIYPIIRVANWPALGGLSKALLIPVAIVIIGMLITIPFRNKIKMSLGRWSAVLVVAGYVSNCIDSMLRDYVVETLWFPFLAFPFNVADVLIYVFCAVFIIWFIREIAPVVLEKLKK